MTGDWRSVLRKKTPGGLGTEKGSCKDISNLGDRIDGRARSSTMGTEARKDMNLGLSSPHDPTNSLTLLINGGAF